MKKTFILFLLLCLCLPFSASAAPTASLQNIPFEAFGGQEWMAYPVTHFFIDHLEEFEILGDTLLGLPFGKNGYIDLRPVGVTYEFRENYERSIAKPGHGILLDNFFPDETSGRETLAALDFFPKSGF